MSNSDPQKLLYHKTYCTSIIKVLLFIQAENKQRREQLEKMAKTIESMQHNLNQVLDDATYSISCISTIVSFSILPKYIIIIN